MAQCEVVLDGELSLEICLDGELESDICLDGDISLDNCLDGELGIVLIVSGAEYPLYTGATEVDPIFDEIVLDTANTTMKDDVTVNPIQVERTSNLAGGQTVYIGGV